MLDRMLGGALREEYQAFRSTTSISGAIILPKAKLFVIT
jgi:hypothetical protein